MLLTLGRHRGLTRRSCLSALPGVPGRRLSIRAGRPLVRQHPDWAPTTGGELDLGFAVRDFKLQSRTKTKLILSLGSRKFRPFFSLSTIYVLASRVRHGTQIRVIGFDPQRDNAYHLTSLQHPQVLSIWQGAYDHEVWSDERLQAAIHSALGGDSLTPLDELADEPNGSDMEEVGMDNDEAADEPSDAVHLG